MRSMQSRKLPRVDDLVNVPEFEDVARTVLDAAVFATIAGGDREPFDRMTFQPRLMVPTLDLDLSVELFGHQHFAPIVAGPVADQRRYHPEAELATVRGASAAQAAVIVSSRSSVAFSEIASQAKTPLWFSVYAGADARRPIERAIAAGCTVICITVGASDRPGARPDRAPIDWKTIATLRRGLDVPVVIKGVMRIEEAKTAVAEGAGGLVVSDHGGLAPVRPNTQGARVAPIEMLAPIVDACAGKVPVLVDGSFRRGSDIAKALVLGAHGVLIGRPVMWGLAAYGADGVQAVIELLQSDAARNLGALGAPNLKSLSRSMVRVHQR
jgi:4-hydroxymandelate oxidase